MSTEQFRAIQSDVTAVIDLVSECRQMPNQSNIIIVTHDHIMRSLLDIQRNLSQALHSKQADKRHLKLAKAH